MSSGGQRGTDLTGIQSMRIQSASDVTARTKARLVYLTSASNAPLGTNGYGGDIPNGNDYYTQFLTGAKEACVSCTGLPWNRTTVMRFR